MEQKAKAVISIAAKITALLRRWCLVLALTFYWGASNAQTDFDIRADSPNLEAEFTKELDAWLLRAYGGERDAQFKVAVLFANDQFRAADHEQAAHWYKQAALQGHILAQYNLGHQYLTGLGVERDEANAMQWWLKAATQEHALSQFNVGRAYYLGIGLETDHKKARHWFERASKNNEPKSTEILKQLGWWSPKVSPHKETSDEQTATTKSPSAELATLADNTKQPSTGAATANSEAQTRTNRSNPIAVFTNPDVRSVLITLVEDPQTLVTLTQQASWVVVRSETGFPVWVSKQFVSTRGNLGKITGSSVNARSVPLITPGSVVGRLNKDEQVSILEQRDDWYRITAPTRFKGWVKRADLTPDDESVETGQATGEPKGNDQTAVTNEPKPSTGQAYSLNDENWLFSKQTSAYTLQLASFADPASTQRFLERLPVSDAEQLRLFTTTTTDDVTWTYILYGDFKDKTSAKAASEKLKLKGAWIRRFSVLQQNRCIAWKKQLPAPKELNQYCI